jgi:hypothetical protein
MDFSSVMALAMRIMAQMDQITQKASPAGEAITYGEIAHVIVNNLNSIDLGQKVVFDGAKVKSTVAFELIAFFTQELWKAAEDSSAKGASVTVAELASSIAIAIRGTKIGNTVAYQSSE